MTWWFIAQQSHARQHASARSQIHNSRPICLYMPSFAKFYRLYIFTVYSGVANNNFFSTFMKPRAPSSFYTDNSKVAILASITSQRGSEALLYRQLLCFRKKNAFCNHSAWKPMNFWNQTWQAWYVGKIYKLTKFGADRLRNLAEMVSPMCTLNGLKDVFWLIHMPFQGFVPSHSIWEGSRSKKPSNLNP